MLLTLGRMRYYKHHLSAVPLLITRFLAWSHLAKAMIDTMQEAARFSWPSCFILLLLFVLVVPPLFQLRGVSHHKMEALAAGCGMALLYSRALLLHGSRRVSYFHSCSCLFSLLGLRQKNGKKDHGFL